MGIWIPAIIQIMRLRIEKRENFSPPVPKPIWFTEVMSFKFERTFSPLWYGTWSWNPSFSCRCHQSKFWFLKTKIKNCYILFIFIEFQLNLKKFCGYVYTISKKLKNCKREVLVFQSIIIRTHKLLVLYINANPPIS